MAVTGPPYPPPNAVPTFPAMSASPGRLRANALALLLVLLVGGFGLPIADALVFHAAVGAPVPSRDAVSAGHQTGPAHLLGCAVWSSPATSTGLPGVPLTPTIALARAPEPHSCFPTARATQTDRTLALSRAPPSA